MANSDMELFYKLLRDNGYSVTQPRLKIFRLLKGHDPKSMRELIQSIGNTIDRASVYRTTSLFERLGIVQRLSVGWKYKLELSDVFESHHHHISCLGCGKLVAVKEDKRIEDLINSLAAKSKMTARSHQLEIQGYCEKCL